MKKVVLFISIIVFAFNTTKVLGQAYTINPVPYNPQPFVGISALGSWVFGGADDGVSGAIPIGFDFCFYGNTYSDFYIGTNGWISFTPSNVTAYVSATIPSPANNIPKNCIMAPWQDWWSVNNGVGNILYQTIGSAPFRKLVVTFLNVPMFSCTQNLGTFQIVLSECTNLIEIHILSKPPCLNWGSGTAVLGLHNLTGTVAHTVPNRNSTVWTVVPTSPEGWEFIPDASCAGSAFGGFASVDTTSFWPVVEANCYTTTIGLKVGDGELVCNTIDTNGSEIRLYTPQGTLLQTQTVSTNCVNGRTDSLTIQLADQFLFNGDHYLVVRNGIDGDGLMGECGTGAFAFDTIIIRVGDCYTYTTQVNMLNVSVNRDNESSTLTWNKPPNFDPDFFDAYRIYVKDSLESANWREFVLITNIDDTTVVTGEVIPTQATKDFKAVLRLKFYGDLRENGDSVNNIWLRTASDELENGLRGMALVQWSAYKGWSPATYEVYVAAWEDTGLGTLVGSTTDTFYSFEKPIEIGKYRVQILTINPAEPRVALSNYVPFELILREVSVPNVITPNGDGANDFLWVEGIEFFPVNTVELYNRWGQRVFSAQNYANQFSPTDLEAGTYIYKVIIPDKDLVQGAIKIIK
jgi:gliding motility-associated-like protein